MLGKLGELNEGYNVLTEMNGQCSDMLMDIGIYKISNGKEELLFDNKNETAVLLLEGTIRLEWEGMEQVIQRQSVFEENPWCLHVSKSVKVTITALSDSEVLVQKRIMIKNLLLSYIPQMSVKVLWLEKEYGRALHSVSFVRFLIITMQYILIW